MLTLLGAAGLFLASRGGWVGDPTHGDASREEGATPGGGPSLAGHREVATTDPVVQAAGVRFVGAGVVRVRNAVTRAPVVGATVTAYFALEVGTAERKPEFYRSGTTDEQGNVLLRQVPLGQVVTVRVGLTGFVTATSQFTVAVDAVSPTPAQPPGSGEPRAQGPSEPSPPHILAEIAMVPALSASEASCILEVASRTAERQLAGVRLVVRDEATGLIGVLEPGQRWFLGDDPAGPSVHACTLQVLGEGFAGPPTRLLLERGKSTTVPIAVPPMRSLAFRVMDERGIPIHEAELEVTADLAPDAHRGLTAVRASTDADGWAHVEARVGVPLRVLTVHPELHLPVPYHRIEPDARDSQAFELRGVRKTRVVLRLVGAEPGGSEATIQWLDYQPDPSTGEALARLSGAAQGSGAVVHARSQLPLRFGLECVAGAPCQGAIYLLPGSYSLFVRCRTAGSAAQSFAALRGEAARWDLVLRQLSSQSYALVYTSAAASISPLFGSIVIGHAAGWDERCVLLDVLGLAWLTETRAPLVTERPEDLDDVVRRLGARLRTLQQRRQGIPSDVGFVDRLGRVSLERPDPSEVLTIIRPDWSVAQIEVRSVLDGGSVDAGPAAFAQVSLDVLDASGRAASGIPIHASSVAAAKAGSRLLSLYRATDGTGRTSMGLLPGEVLAIYPVNRGWREVRGDPASVVTPALDDLGKEYFVLRGAPSTGRVLIVLR